MKRYLIYSLLSVLMCNYQISAQISDPNLEIEIKETISKACIHKVKALTDHFAKIAEKKESDDVKDYHIEACLDLFMGRGNDTKDDDGNLIFPAPRIEVSSLATGSVNSYFIKNYLVRLKGLQYSKIVFKNSACYLAEGGIKKVNENQYSTIVSFYQVFIGYNGDLIVYRDKTQKTVKVLIEKDNLGRYEIYLGDIKVVQTDDTNLK